MVHLHFGPSVLYRDCFTPPALRHPGQALGRSVVNRLIRRVGLSPTSRAPFAGCCRVEYYAELGEIGHFGNANEQQHQLFPTLDLNFSPEWEFNFGVGFGLTRRTDGLLIKLIVGRRF